MKHQFKLTATVAAVAALYGVNAQAALTVFGEFFGGGASAAANGFRGAIETSTNMCGAAGIVGGISLYETAASGAGIGSGNQLRFECSDGVNTLIVHYDLSGGSWKGLGVFPGVFTAAQNDKSVDSHAPNSFSPNNYQYVDPAHTGCVAHAGNPVADPYSGVLINDFQGCTPPPPGAGATVVYPAGGLLSGPHTNLDFGLTDVETKQFQGFTSNQPLAASSLSPTFAATNLDATWAADIAGGEGVGGNTNVFGIVFGVAASSNLYFAMQTDQAGSTLSYLPATCAGMPFASHECAPIISAAQYRSMIATAANGILNSGTLSGLFPNGHFPADLSLFVARRDQGSGTQASSNNYFLRQGCGTSAFENPDLLPALPSSSKAGYTVNYDQTTGAVTTDLAQPSNVVGWVSAEKDPLTSAGFLRLDGVYPSNTNAALGLYNAVGFETLHVPNPQTAGTAALITDLTAVLKSYANVGILDTTVAAAPTAFPALTAGHGGNPANTYFQSGTANIGRLCGGFRAK